MNRAKVIADRLTQLHIQEYRNGFNDSVLSHCRDAVEAFEPGSGREFWNQMLRGDRGEALVNFLDNDKDLLNYFDKVDKNASGPGAFEMPHWGTRGT